MIFQCGGGSRSVGGGLGGDLASVLVPHVDGEDGLGGKCGIAVGALETRTPIDRMGCHVSFQITVLEESWGKKRKYTS